MQTDYVTTASSASVEDSRHKLLTEKEWEFLELLAKGFTTKTIAAKLFLVEKTIQDRSIRVYTKLGFSHRPESNPRVLAALWYWGITTNSVRNGNT